MSAPRRLLAVLLATVLAAGLSACVGLPDNGPVVRVDVGQDDDADLATGIDPVPPRDGASRQAVVAGYLEAMMAWPIDTTVARQYLSDDAASGWNPEKGMIVYSDAAPPQEVGGSVSVDLADTERLDASGGWQGTAVSGPRTMRFQLTAENGDFRIVDPPDALVVSESWFEPRYRQVSLYFFDPIAQILVPQPVFLPVGEQLASTLVSALLAGPSERLRDVVTTFVPSGFDAGLSVPVTDDGVAVVDLTGRGPRPSPEEAELMFAQLAWTLRQDAEVTSIRLSIDGEPVPLPGGTRDYLVSEAAEFDPAGARSSSMLYGLSDGRLVAGLPGSLTPVQGAFGDRFYDLTEVAVAPTADRAAVIADGGTTVLVGPVQSQGGVRTVLSGAADLARPTWDHAGRMWVLDRTSSGAVVYVVEGRSVREIRVPRVTGLRAQRLLVSRDGTRLVAVVRDAAGDHLVTTRVRIGGTGDVEEVLLPVEVPALGGQPRIVDLAWTSPATITVVSPTRPRSLFEIDSVVVDGVFGDVDTVSTIVTGAVLGIAGSPDSDDPSWAVRRTSVVDVRTRSTASLDEPVTALHYAG